MSLRKLLFPAALVMAASVNVPALAQADDAWVWLRAESGEPVFSVQLPCSQAEIDNFSQRAEVNGPTPGRPTLACYRNGMLFSASQVTVPEGTELQQPLFDMIAAGLREAEPDAGTIIDEVMIAGRRAIVSRQEQGGLVAETRVIEISDRRYVMMIAGSGFGGGTGPAGTGQYLDQYFASLEVES